MGGKRGLASLLLLTWALTAATPTRAPAAERPAHAVVGIDWQMPERFDPARGIPRTTDYSTIDGVLSDTAVDPASWPTTLFPTTAAGKPAHCVAGATYRWTVATADTGIRIAQPTVISPAGSCRVTYPFPAEGTYTVSLRIDANQQPAVQATQSVVIQDYLVLAIGDGYASGDGLPDQPGRYAYPSALSPFGELGPDYFGLRGTRTSLRKVKPVGWEFAQCDRSLRSSDALAAAALEQSDSHTSVTFVDTACAGARIRDLLNNPYEGAQPDLGSPLDPQLEQVYSRLFLPSGHLRREVDAVLLSIGAGDVHLGAIIQACAGPAAALAVPRPTSVAASDDCRRAAAQIHDSTNAAHLTGFDPRLAAYVAVEKAGIAGQGAAAILASFTADGQHYVVLRSSATGAVLAKVADNAVGALQSSGFYKTIARTMKAMAIDPSRVIVTPYPFPSRGRGARPCGGGFPAAGSQVGIDAAEATWLSGTVVGGLDDALAAVARDNGWTVAAQPADPAGRHGFCRSSPGRWALLPLESLQAEGSASGAMLPTATLATAQATLLLRALERQLAPGGNARAPRRVARVKAFTAHEYATGLGAFQPARIYSIDAGRPGIVP